MAIPAPNASGKNGQNPQQPPQLPARRLAVLLESVRAIPRMSEVRFIPELSSTNTSLELRFSQSPFHQQPAIEVQVRCPAPLGTAFSQLPLNLL